jgi:hypothetical protein
VNKSWHDQGATQQRKRLFLGAESGARPVAAILTPEAEEVLCSKRALDSGPQAQKQPILRVFSARPWSVKWTT